MEKRRSPEESKESRGGSNNTNPSPLFQNVENTADNGNDEIIVEEMSASEEED
jgi:hypothetical protein